MSKHKNADEYVRKSDVVDAVAFGITTAKAIDIETGESRDLFANENEELRKAFKRIEALPSADVKENIHGEWINKRTMQHDGEFYCSACDFVLDTFMQGVFYNFCPNCGADMRGEQ